jgi:hypothetical protein
MRGDQIHGVDVVYVGLDKLSSPWKDRLMFPQSLALPRFNRSRGADYVNLAIQARQHSFHCSGTATLSCLSLRFSLCESYGDDDADHSTRDHLP